MEKLPPWTCADRTCRAYLAKEDVEWRRILACFANFILHKDDLKSMTFISANGDGRCRVRVRERAQRLRRRSLESHGAVIFNLARWAAGPAKIA